MTSSPLPFVAIARALDGVAKSGLTITLGFYLYERTGSGIWAVAPFVALYLTGVLATPVSGWLIDRLGAWKVAIGSLACEAICVMAMALTSTPSLLVGIVTLAFVFEAPFAAACAYAIGSHADEQRMATWVARIQGARIFGGIIGPPLLASLLIWAGLSVTMAIAGGLLLLATMPLTTASRQAAVTSIEHDEDLQWNADELLDGVRVLRADVTLTAIAITLVLGYLALSGVLPAEIAVTEQRGSAVAYGVLNALIAVGSLFGLSLAARARPRREVPLLLGTLLTLVIAYLGAAVSTSLIALIAFLSLSGIVEGVMSSVEQTSVLHRVDGAVRGRALAAMEAIATFGALLPLVVAGWLFDAVGASAVFLIAVAITCLAMLPLLVLRVSSSYTAGDLHEASPRARGTVIRVAGSTAVGDQVSDRAIEST